MSTEDTRPTRQWPAWLERLRNFASDHAGKLPALAGIAVLAWLAQSWLNAPFGRETTLGQIWIDSPEIYTRERLVNDRFVQDAWLSQHLSRRRDVVESLQSFEERRSAQVRPSLIAGEEPAASASAAARTASGEQGTSGVSTRDRLLAELDFRELIRNLAAENQLDDRHDLGGNSLYRFKFDASILPGRNTQATAVVNVGLRSSHAAPAAASAPAAQGKPLSALAELGTRDSIDHWREVYGRWIESLRSRLNQTHKELKQGYVSNEFGHNDYVRLIAFLERNLGIPASKQPSCPSSIVDLRDQGLDPARLRAEQHTKRKACVLALIDRQIAKLEAQAAASRAGETTYIVKTERRSPPPNFPNLPKLPAASDVTQRVAHELDKWLNTFFASKSVQLVLGISVPDYAFVGVAFYEVKTLEQLIKLSFFSSETTNVDGNVFYVTQRIFPVMAIDPKEVSADRFGTLSAPGEALAGLSYEDFKPLENVPPDRLLVSRTGLRNLGGEAYALSGTDFQPVPGFKGVYSAIAELGLLNFVRKARVSAQAFTYAVTPKESADNISLSLGSDARIDASGLLKAAESLGLAMSRETSARAVARRGSVVGFGSVSSNDRAEFGWIIGPRVPSFDGQNLTYVQGVGQYSLSALVSLPAWWNQVVLEVETYWVGPDGKPLKGSNERREYMVEVPTDFEPLETTLLEVPQLGPELMESRLDPVALTACRGGAIVIPGRRLWRSTRVTLGYQTADEISVLPNMKGIIATFGNVQNQMTQSEASAVRAEPNRRGVMEIQRPVRVWTSQGTLTLPSWATIGIPVACESAQEVGVVPRPAAAPHAR